MCFEIEMLVGGPEVGFSNRDILSIRRNRLSYWHILLNGWQWSVWLANSVLMAVESLVRILYKRFLSVKALVGVFSDREYIVNIDVHIHQSQNWKTLTQSP